MCKFFMNYWNAGRFRQLLGFRQRLSGLKIKAVFCVSAHKHVVQTEKMCYIKK